MLKNVTRVALIVLLLGGLFAACGDDDDGGATATTAAGAETPELKVIGNEYSFSTASSVKGGYVKVTLENKGKEDHQAQLLRINDGVTPQQLQEAATDTTGEKLLGLTTISGGVNGIAGGTTQSAVTKLDPGSYLMLCFIPAPDGQPHVAKGMQTQLTVSAPAAEGTEPKYDFEVVGKDFTFDIPAIKSGEHTIEFKNDGPSPHEATLYKVADGKTADDVQKFLATPPGTPPSGPPPFAGAGGGAAIMPNTGTFPTIDFTPGTYVFTCFVPDQKTGKPHIQLGMFKAFEVK
ncbi:MAG: hypothetical protein QOG87_2458 [Actinomycetota bacterium]|jgi:plastocyanin